MAVSLQNATAALIALAALVYAFDMHNAFLHQAQISFTSQEIG